MPRAVSFLNDITLNMTEQTDRLAFLLDSELGSLVVLSLSQDRAWQVSHSAIRAQVSGATFCFFLPFSKAEASDDNNRGQQRKLFYSGNNKSSFRRSDFKIFAGSE